MHTICNLQCKMYIIHVCRCIYIFTDCEVTSPNPVITYIIDIIHGTGLETSHVSACTQYVDAGAIRVTVIRTLNVRKRLYPHCTCRHRLVPSCGTVPVLLSVVGPR